MSTPDLFIGIMSGTSLDGIDVAVARFTGTVECVAHESFGFDPAIRDLLYDLATTKQVDLDRFVRSHFLLSELYSNAVKQTLQKHGITISSIRAIGLHGQTIRHLPEAQQLTPDSKAIRATFQLGSGPTLAALSGIDVVSDFRSADVALGGQGAPLVPMFDTVFLRSDTVTRVALNIGGIANITIIPPRSSSAPIIAYDTGPGNMLIDELTRLYFDKAYDNQGQIAAGAKVNEAVLSELLCHRYFTTPAPKSTGRELFGHEFLTSVTSLIESGQLRADDAISTATELTARSVANELSMIHGEIIVSGGGGYNTFLISRLKALLPDMSIYSSDVLGIPSQAKEAIAFAFFAKAFLSEERIHLPHTTGANRQIILGSLSKGK